MLKRINCLTQENCMKFKWQFSPIKFSRYPAVPIDWCIIWGYFVGLGSEWEREDREEGQGLCPFKKHLKNSGMLRSTHVTSVCASVMGRTVCPKRCVEVLTPVPASVALFGNQVFEDVIKLEVMLDKKGPNPMTCVLLRTWWHRDTGKKVCENRTRDWSEAIISQRMLKMGCQKPQRSKLDPPADLPTPPFQTYMFRNDERTDIKVMLFVVICYSSLQRKTRLDVSHFTWQC